MTNKGIPTRNLAQYQALHASKRYGTSAIRREELIVPTLRTSNARFFLDYGCGRCDTIPRVARLMGAKGFLFDPAIPEIATIPQEFLDSPYESRLVLCSHVLEHLDREEVDKVLQHIKSLAPKAVFLIPTTKARQVLPNGENAHSTVRSKEWWLKVIASYFPDTSNLRSLNRTELLLATWKTTRPRKVARSAPRRNPMLRRKKPVSAGHLKDFTGKSVAIVGRANSIIGSGDGARIDACDVVIRVNIPLPLDKAQAKDIGTKTSLIYTCRNCRPAQNAAIQHGVPFEPYDRAFRMASSGSDGYTPFTGTMAILEAFRRGAAKVFATGMDLYSGKAITASGGHLRLSKKNTHSFHDPNRDKELLKGLMLKHGEAFEPSDVLRTCIESEEPLKHFKGLTPHDKPPSPPQPRPRRQKRRSPVASPIPSVAGKAVAIVGRSAKLIGSGQGKLIDSFDVVVRVNTILPLKEDMADDIGKRADIVYLCHHCGVQHPAMRSAEKLGVKWMQLNSTYRRSIGDSIASGFVPFTGTMAILEFLRLNPAKLYVVGFDLYVGPPAVFDNRNGLGHSGKMKMRNGYHSSEHERTLLKKIQENPRLELWEPLREVLATDGTLLHYKTLQQQGALK